MWWFTGIAHPVFKSENWILLQKSYSSLSLTKKFLLSLFYKKLLLSLSLSLLQKKLLLSLSLELLSWKLL